MGLADLIWASSWAAGGHPGRSADLGWAPACLSVYSTLISANRGYSAPLHVSASSGLTWNYSPRDGHVLVWGQECWAVLAHTSLSKSYRPNSESRGGKIDLPLLRMTAKSHGKECEPKKRQKKIGVINTINLGHSRFSG